MSINCRWCERGNPAGEEFCHHCGHNLRRPRRECDCFRCVQRRSLADQILGLYEEEKRQFDSMFDEDIKKRFDEIGKEK